MKRILTIGSTIVVLLIMTNTRVIGQTQDTSAFEFFVYLGDNFMEDSIEMYLDDLNASKVWQLPNKLCLWKVNGFPFTSNSGQTYFDIHAVIQSSKRKTQIKEADYNIAWTVSPETVNANASCFDPMDYAVTDDNNTKITISILDTGISPSISSSSMPGYNYDLTNYTGYDYVNDDNIPEDEHGHGTHVAGIIHSITHALNTNADIDFDIRKTHNAEGKAYAADVIKAMHDAMDANADIINMSFGAKDTFEMGKFFPLRVALNTAYQRGVLVVAAAGNEGDNIDIAAQSTIPASFPEDNLITVAALNCADSLTFFSNYGKDQSDVASMGWKVAGPDLMGGIKYVSGTSQATAIVTAQAALLGTYMDAFDPVTAKCLLQGSVTSLPQLDTMVATGGKINLSFAITLLANTSNNYVVTNTLETGPGSLRYGLEKHCFIDQINFAASTSGQVIPIAARDLKIFKNISLNGLGVSQTILSVQGDHRGITTGSNSVLTLKNLSITNNGTSGQTILNRGKIEIENAKIK
ncbi:MAG: S8 family serine peptidase [Saprospiraceae bacterium]